MSRVPHHTIFVAAAMLVLACSQQGSAPPQKASGAVPSAEAKALHEKGREAGGRGDYAAALKLFTDAAALAPDCPIPSLGKHDEATEILRAVAGAPRSTAATVSWAKVLLTRK